MTGIPLSDGWSFPNAMRYIGHGHAIEIAVCDCRSRGLSALSIHHDGYPSHRLEPFSSIQAPWHDQLRVRDVGGSKT